MRYLFCLVLSIISLNAYAFSIPEGASFAAKIIDLDADEVVYEYNPESLLLPASNQKLVTLYSALKMLDVNKSFRTSVFADSSIKNGVIDGNLYFKFSGDPELRGEDVIKLVTALKARGVEKITKDVIIDDSEFDDEFFGHGWSVDQTKFCFSAPVSAINIDHNCFLVGLKKSEKGFDLKHNKYPTFAKILNKAHNTKEPKRHCDFELKAFADNTYILDGCYQKNTLPNYLRIAVQNPRRNGMELVSYLLKAEDINFRAIKIGETKYGSEQLTFVDSRPIKEMLKDMVKQSDNLISEAIFKRISAHNTNYSGGWKNSASLTKSLLIKNLDLESSDFVVADGSGSSRKNLISPEILVRLLKSSYEDRKIKKEFIDCLAIAGKDGTLKTRFRYSELSNNVFAKSGSLDNVSTLSGYAFLPSGKNYAFSIMLNNSTHNYSKMKGFEEDILGDILTNRW